MKKLLLVTVVFGALAMTSCSKRYCDLDGDNISGSANVSKSDCEAVGGQWVKE